MSAPSGGRPWRSWERSLKIRLLHSLADRPAQLEHAAPERAAVDPVAVGIVNAAMAQSALEVKAALDDFLVVDTAAGLVETK